MNFIINISLLGSIFYILFKILEKFLNNNLTSNFYYKLSKIIALAFIIPISYILSLYLPDFNKYYNKIENTQQIITENTNTLMFNNTLNNNITISENITNNITKENINTNLINNNKEISIIKNTPSISYKLIFNITYILGMICFIFINIIFFIKFKLNINKSTIILNNNYNNILNNVKQKLNIKKNILLFENENIFSPMLVGILNPKIILPKKNISLQDLELILTHELIHFQRKDLITKLILLFINIINYFNPLMYFLIKDIDKWCEYSCDEKLIKIYNNNQKNYCLAILNGLNPNQNHNIHFSTTFACNKNNLKRRLENIMTKDKPKNKLKITFVGSFFILSCIIFILAFSIFYSNNKINVLAKDNIERTFDEPVYLDSGNRAYITPDKEVPMTTEILSEKKAEQLKPEILLKGTFKKEEPSVGSMELDFITRRFYNDTTYSTDKYIKIDLENIEKLTYDPKNTLNLYCRIKGKYINKFTGEIEEIYLGKFAVPKNEKRTFVFETIPDIYSYKLVFQHPNSYAPSFNLEVTAGYTLDSLGVNSVSTIPIEENILLKYSDNQRLNNIHKDPKRAENTQYFGYSRTRTYQLECGFYKNLTLQLENKSNDDYTLFMYDKSLDVYKDNDIWDYKKSILYKEYDIPANTTINENFTNALMKKYDIHLVPNDLKDAYLKLLDLDEEISLLSEEKGEDNPKVKKLVNEYETLENNYFAEYENYIKNQKGSIYYKFSN